MSLVSVVIPTYNRAFFVGEAVDSVLGQTFDKWELLVVDDGSTDETESRLREHRESLRYIKTPHRGVGAARNVGIREARGDWVAFLDSDDLWFPNKLERQIEALHGAPGAPLCYTDEIWVRNGVRVNPRLRHQKHWGWIFEKCLPLCIISPSSALIFKGLLLELGGFDENLPACEDYDLWLRITLRHPVIFLDEKLIIKRGGHPDQLSRGHWGMDRFRVRSLWKILRDPFLQEIQRERVLAELQRKCEILAKGARKRGKSREAVFYEKLMQAKGLEVENAWATILYPSEESGYE
jgi:glycosyltransferase involved in cell wall biosynthesis